MYHWAPPELLDEPLSHLLGLAPDQVQDIDDLPHTHSELVEGLQVDLDSSDRQPLHLPHGSYHGHRLGAHPTPSHHLPGKIHLGHVGLTTLGTFPLQVYVLGHLCRHYRNMQHLPSMLHRAAQELAAASRAELHRMHYPPRRLLPLASEALLPLLAGTFLLGFLSVGPYEARHGLPRGRPELRLKLSHPLSKLCYQLPQLRVLRPQSRDEQFLLLSLIHISEPTRLGMISYAVFC